MITLPKQSTKTINEEKETISLPKQTCQSRDLHFYYLTNSYSSENTTKTSNLITTINLIGPQNDANNLTTEGNLPNPSNSYLHRFDKNTTKTCNYITTININGIETNQTISWPKVTEKVVILLSKSSCWRLIFIKHKQNA